MAAADDNVLCRLLDALRGATRLWSRREPYDAELVVAVMEMLVAERHRRWRTGIPVYGRIAGETGVGDSAELPTIVDAMLFSTDVFKSYAPEALDQGDFEAMGDWLRDVSSCRPSPGTAAAGDLREWRAALAREGVRVSLSSGTSGRPSLVPRDEATWDALCNNGRYYADDSGTRPGAFDLLVLMPPGDALGLQSAAIGLARSAGAAHFLDGDDFGGAIAFLATSIAGARPVIVFGPPHRAAALCDAIAADGRAQPLAPGSRLITGGGWKGARPIDSGELEESVRGALGLEGGAMTDAYSATELNCVLSRCPEGRYHAPPLIQPLLFDDALEWNPDAETTGLLGFFDPFAASYPGLLVTGDQGHLTREPCSCGLTGWSISGPITRAPGQAPRGCAGALAA